MLGATLQRRASFPESSEQNADLGCALAAVAAGEDFWSHLRSRDCLKQQCIREYEYAAWNYLLIDESA